MSVAQPLARTVAQRLARIFARCVTLVTVREPRLWPVLRGAMAWQFDRLAPTWDTIIGTPDHLAPLEAALDSLPAAPTRILDIGTGTGAAAFNLARRYPDAEVVGVDVAPRMIDKARRNVDPAVADRVTLEVGDASSLRFADAAFDLVTLVNAIPFFDELGRVVAPNGYVVFSFSSGAETPIYVPPERLERELRARGFTQFATFSTGRGRAFLARKTRAA